MTEADYLAICDYYDNVVKDYQGMLREVAAICGCGIFDPSLAVQAEPVVAYCKIADLVRERLDGKQ